MVLAHQQQQHLSHLDRVGIVFQKYRVCAKVNKRRLFINGYTEKNVQLAHHKKAVEDTRETNTKKYLDDTVP